MSEDNITRMDDFRQRRGEATDALLSLPGGDPNMPVTGEPTPNPSPEHPFGYGITEMDVEAFMNIRNWLEFEQPPAKSTRLH